jgi:hypothetical protein
MPDDLHRICAEQSASKHPGIRGFHFVHFLAKTLHSFPAVRSLPPAQPGSQIACPNMVKALFLRGMEEEIPRFSTFWNL